MSIIKRFRRQLEKNKNKKIIVSPTDYFTMNELDIYSDIIHYKLLSTANEIVPMYIKNDLYILPAILGIIKAGKIPLPLVTALELEKSLDRISDVDFNMLLTDIEGNFKELNVIELKDKRSFCNDLLKNRVDLPEVGENEISYIISTSGTTGFPKKVRLSKDNIDWLINTFYELIELQEDSNFLFTTPYTFDVSLTEILAPIYAGATLYCFENNTDNISKLRETLSCLNEYKITHLSLSPSYAELLTDIGEAKDFENLKYVCVAGEVFSKTLAEKILPLVNKNCKILNLYGPSETTIYASYYELTGKEGQYIPIGKPLSGANLLLLDENYQPSNKGELYISGKGVTKGYMLQPNLNEQKFPVINGTRYYRTGDFAFYDSKNEIVFDKRKDDQIQIRGIRVEIEEVNSIILNCKLVKSCRTVYKDNKLFVFYIPFNKGVEEEVKKYAQTNLPKYLSPILVLVDNFYLTPNRKLDTNKMISHYYFKSNNSFQEDKIERIVLDLLKKYGVRDVNELDSLDTLKFILDLEQSFDIVIEDSNIPNLTTNSNIFNFLNNADVIERRIENRNIESDLDNDISNLKAMVNNYVGKYDLEDGYIPTLYLQKNYNLKKYNSILYFDLKVEGETCQVIRETRDKIVQISEYVDCIRMVLYNEINDLKFKKIKYDAFKPVICTVKHFISDEFIKDIIYENHGTPLFFVCYSLSEKCLRFYFSHHILDQSSLNKFAKLFAKAGNNLKSNREIYSYGEFIKFIKQNTAKITLSEVNKIIPITTDEINHTNNSKSIQIARFNCSEKDSILVTLKSIYLITNCLFQETDKKTLTGSFISNIREFNDFDAEEVIGDIHSTVPFQIIKGESLRTFISNAKKYIAYYKSGKNLRDKIFEGYPHFEGEYKKLKVKWDSMNLAVNYVGEVRNINDFITEIMNVKFKEKYIIIFTSNNVIYTAIIGNFLSKDKYIVENTEVEICNVIK